MNCFFDTSALAKLFQKEEGSDFVEKLINAPENDIWILDLTRIELLSSVYRRYRQKDISEKELEIIFNADIGIDTTTAAKSGTGFFASVKELIYGNIQQLVYNPNDVVSTLMNLSVLIIFIFMNTIGKKY